MWCVPVGERVECPSVDLVLRLGERTAGRTCQFCSGDAADYVYSDGVAPLYLYACKDDLDAVVTEAQV